jgi:glyoxylase-like metal-dependent hydrolase (beta-lactamase superfamily II)
LSCSFLPAPLPTGFLGKGLWVIRDGFVNLYVLEGFEGLVALDAGWRPRHIEKSFRLLGLDPGEVMAVLLTHAHWDHGRGAACFPKAKVYGAETSQHTIKNGEFLSVAGLRVQAIGCPGHTADSLAFLAPEGRLFTGDSLRLRQGEVHPNLAWFNRDNEALHRSIQGLAALRVPGPLFTAHWGMVANAAFALDRWSTREERP